MQSVSLHEALSPTMDHDLESKKHVAHEIEDEATFAEKASIADYKANAIEAENAEHNMTVIEAVKAYPMASFWAFVMSCTIVSSIFPDQSMIDELLLTIPDHGILRRLPHR